jgi:peroxiredoxin/mono/diheme cytochrome c family protein
MRQLGLIAAIVAGVCCGMIVSAAENARTPIGKQVESFTLPDFHGKDHSLSNHDGKVVVLAFLGTQCPLAKSYSPRLRDLAAAFEPQGVVFVGIDANMQDSLTEIASFARLMEIPFPILKDKNNLVADRLGAERTPEVFLLDKSHVIRYWGRIDDQYGFKTGAGYVKPRLTQRNLADAIAQVLAGKEVIRPVVKAEGCLIGRVVKVEPRGDVTYSNQIARLMQNRCVECHRPGELAPFTLTSYGDAVGWAEMIREVVREGRMPPWFADPKYGHFANDARLSDDEQKQILAWIENGCPEGDPKDLPEPRQFTLGWKIGEPDEVFRMSNKPFQVPAEGVVDYKFFTVDPGWTTDRWVSAAESRPGNRGVVHHIIVSAFPKGADPRDVLSGIGLGGYAPGTIPLICQPGVAVHVPAGAKLVFQMHYTPNGTAQEDTSIIGVRYADPKTVKKVLDDGLLGKINFRIPPGDPNFELKSKYLIDKDALLLDLTPHMHLRGKSFRFEAEYPDGNREVLLDVPNYDFNWQLTYVLSKPKLLPKGTFLHGIAHFDNSPENPANPDSTRSVAYGEQTWDEMMFGFYSMIDPNQDLTTVASKTAEPQTGEANQN